MNPELWQQLPVYRRIEHELKNYIAKRKLKRHDRLPSESQLAAEYSASIGTVRKALNNLEAEKVIYRRHGQGTFVAPRSRRGKILLVSNLEHIYEISHEDFMEFFVGTLSYANTANLAYEPMIVELEDFLENLNDVPMVYPETAGVIFFRGYSNVLRPSAKALQRQNIPFMYYGGNFYPEIEDLCPAVYHNEDAIAALMADYYQERGYRKVAGIVNTELVTIERSRRFRAEIERRGIAYQEFGMTEDPVKIAGSCEVINCFTDSQAVRLVQTLERECGLRVPDRIAVSGVDYMYPGWLKPELTTIDLCHRANGRYTMQVFTDYIENPRKKSFHLNGELKLIRGESC